MQIIDKDNVGGLAAGFAESLSDDILVAGFVDHCFGAHLWSGDQSEYRELLVANVREILNDRDLEVVDIEVEGKNRWILIYDPRLVIHLALNKPAPQQVWFKLRKCGWFDVGDNEKSLLFHFVLHR